MTRYLVNRPKRVPAPGVLVYMQKTPHALIAANNVTAFFAGPSSKDVCVGKIVTRNGGVSQFIPEPTKPTKPRELTTKNFLGYCLVNKAQVPLVIPATGYMKARERVLRLAASIHHDLPTLTLPFYLRRQVVEAGERRASATTKRSSPLHASSLRGSRLAMFLLMPVMDHAASFETV